MSGALGRIAGGAIGFALSGGNPAGFKYGWAVGSLLDGPQGQDTHGPRIEDLSAPALEYGSSIHKLYGKGKIPGFVIWSAPLRETKKEEKAGKGGGPTHTSYTYDVTMAVAIGKGVIDGYLEIWANNKLIYKIDANSTLEEIIASNSAAENITFYPGSETQQPDPTIQAYEGVENTQAYRGISYLVIERLPLEDFGNSRPVISVVAVSEATSVAITELNTVEIIPDDGYTAGSGEWGAAQDYANGEFSIVDRAAVTMKKISINGTITDSVPLTIDGYMYFDNQLLNGSKIIGGQSASTGSLMFTVGFIGEHRIMQAEGGSALISNNLALEVARVTMGRPYKSGDNYTSAELSAPTIRTDLGTIDQLLADNGYANKYHHATKTANDWSFGLFLLGDSNLLIDTWVKVDASKNIIASGTASPTITANEFTSIEASGSGSFSIEPDGDHIWVLDRGTSDFRLRLYKIGSDGNLAEIASQLAITLGGHVVADPVLLAVNGACIIFHGATHITGVARGIYTGSTIQLSTVVDSELNKAGITNADVSALTDTVDGYVRTRQTSARAAIEPLQTAYLFDLPEINGVITAVKRGGSSIAMIPEAQLGANSDVVMKHTRQQEAELPSKVVVNYIDPDNGYDQGSQSFSRINYTVENVATVSLPIVLSADKAKQLAEILLVNAWLERDKFQSSLTRDYIDLNPSDIITPTFDNQTRVMRIDKASYGSVIALECVAEDGLVYTSNAIAEPSNYVPQTVGLKGPTVFHFLDIPMLRNSDNDEGVYVAVAGVFNAWTGAEIYKSTDGGATYASVEQLFDGATVGYTTNVLPDGPTTLIDRTSSVNISLQSGSLSSVSETQLLNGANACVIGDEICLFANATVEVDGSITLDTFLRGQRGTEWATTTHAASDRFVLLDENALDRMTAAYNLERDYKPVSLGTYLDDASSEKHTNTGVSLKPFSPTFVRGSRNGANDLTITWLRRSRYIGAGLSSLPMIEETESYEIDVMNGASVVRTISASSETASYSAANQTSDGLTPGNAITVRVYQISATVGRGYVKEVTI